MDYALPFRKELIANAGGRALTTDEHLRVIRTRMAHRRARALLVLGERWVLHSDYKPELHPHHTPRQKESALLKPVMEKARAEGRL